MAVNVGQDRLDAPWFVPGSQDKMYIVAILDQPTGEIRANESTRAGNDNALHCSDEVVVIEFLQILPGVIANLILFVRR